MEYIGQIHLPERVRSGARVVSLVRSSCPVRERDGALVFFRYRPRRDIGREVDTAEV
jgi:hypothetical protein